VKIISGSFKNKSLATPKDSSVRPTTDKVRNAIFSSLYDRVEGAKVLDLFCGTGAFGLEALSRGASHCTFVDIKPDFVKKNCEMAEKGTFQVIKGKVESVVERFSEKFDIIFIDPPYGTVAPQGLLELISKYEILANEGILIYEESVRTAFEYPEGFELEGEKKYGDTKIYYLSVMI
jgi:16S rRNA (guanine(966)-N(2))-methyltransferase RsmD